MISFDAKNQINITDLSLTSGSVSDAPKLTTTTTTKINIGQKVELTPEEKQEMLLLGMNPDNETDVNSYRILTPKEKAQKLEIAKNPVKESVVSPKVNLNFDKILNEKYKINTNSEDWKNKTDAEKLDYVVKTGTKAQFSDAEWNAKSDNQKKQAMHKFANNALGDYIPNWDKMSETEKLNKMSDIVTMYAIAKENGMHLDEIINLKNNSPKKFEEIEKSYYENGHTKIDLVKDKKAAQDQMTEFYNEHTNELAEYCGVDNINKIDQLNFAEKEFEFLKAKKKKGELDNLYQRRKLNTYQELEANLGADNVKKLQPGNRRLIDLLSQDEVQQLDLVKDDEGKINYFNKENIDKIKQATLKKIYSCKNSDEIETLLKGLGAEYIVTIIDEIGKSEELPEEFLTAFEKLVGSNVSMALFDTNGIIRNPKGRSKKLQAYDAQTKIHNLEKLGIKDPELQKVLQTAMTANYTKENAAQAQVTVAEMDRKDLLEAGNKAIAERDDALDVFDYTNGMFAKSETISDEMKEFYAQTSIEYLSPELRDQQAESLRYYGAQYGCESFEKGIETGYANAAYNDSHGSSSDGYHADNNIVYNDNYLQYTQNSQEHTYSQNYNLTDSDILQKLSEMKSYKEKEDFVRTNNISPSICNKEPSLVQYFVNKGEGMSIIENCSVPIGDDAIKLMKKIPKEMKKLVVLVPHGRLSRVTQEELETRGIINPKNPNASMNSYKG